MTKHNIATSVPFIHFTWITHVRVSVTWELNLPNVMAKSTSTASASQPNYKFCTLTFSKAASRLLAKNYLQAGFLQVEKMSVEMFEMLSLLKFCVLHLEILDKIILEQQ